MSKGGFDLREFTQYARVSLMHDAALADGVVQYTGGVFAETGAQSGTKLEVEPRKRSEPSPAAGPGLDELSRIAVYTSYSGTMVAANLHVQLQLARKTTGYIDIGPNLKVAEASAGCNSHIIENPFPANFCQDSTQAIDINDTLVARMQIIPSASSTGNVLVWAIALLIPGPQSTVQTPPRGTVFSIRGQDY